MEIMILIFVFIFGLIIGSFLNCLIWRLHTGEGMWNRSYCPKCRQMIAWYDNIPLLSFLLLKGKCRHCHGAISWQYPIIEFVTGILFVAVFYLNNELRIMNYEFFSLSIIQLIRDWFIIAVMIIIFIYDLRWYLILDIVTLPACAIIFILNIWLGFDWLNLIFSGIIGSSFFLLQYAISKGKWIGGGDIRLGLLIGLSLGWPNVILAIFLAYLIGSLAAIPMLIMKKKDWKSEIPLGIFLSTAAIITLFWGDKILNWYFGLLFF
jgi:prepilin signal peptidase PulO-like enzyme (type II secretory pathway)